MADYYSPTIVQPDIPVAAMTPLERKLLCTLFEHEGGEEGIYFFARENVSDIAWIDTAELRALLDEGAGIESDIADIVRAEIDKADPDDEELELDLSMIGFEGMFQDIVRRSPDLDHVQVVAAWTCTKMRPDGFGGMATIITADTVESMSTSSFIGEVLARLDDEPPSAI